MTAIDETHDPGLKCWVESASFEGSDFPVQNLPFGVFDAGAGPRAGPRVGVAIGDQVLDVARAADLMADDARAAAQACAAGSLNRLMAMGRQASGALRRGLSRMLTDPAMQGPATPLLTPMTEVAMRLPVEVGDYTDFYASIHHATNVGRMLRPDSPLFPNYKWIPIGYHGRASTVRVSGSTVRRPTGQAMPRDAQTPPVRPSRNLDYELELGAFIGAPCPADAPTPIARAGEHLFGVCLLNDWSARDIQGWEYQPLGPFLAKSFCTSISPWVVTAEALAPFRAPLASRPAGDPEPLPYLDDPEDRSAGAFAIRMEAWLQSERMRSEGMAPVRVSSASFTDMYWTLAQMIAHHTSNGCDLRTGDLLGSGTVSGPDRSTAGCLLEITARGAEPVALPSGETRAFLEDGDEVTLRGRCEREGFVPIGLGECRGRVLPA
jgi:fumarylacetoacetase